MITNSLVDPPLPRTKIYSLPNLSSGTGWSAPASLAPLLVTPKFNIPLLMAMSLSDTIDAPIQPSMLAAAPSLAASST